MPQQKQLSTDSCEAKYMQMLALCGRGFSHTSTVAAAPQGNEDFCAVLIAGMPQAKFPGLTATACPRPRSQGMFKSGSSQRLSSR